MSMASTGTAEVTLPTDDQILITREFDAPPELVFEAWTKPDLVKRWWGARRGSGTTAEIDLRVGGEWRFTHQADGGFEVAFHGTYREIVPNERLAYTEIFEGAPDAESVIEQTFTAVGTDRCRVEQLCRYPSREVRDIVLESGMEAGMQESMDALEEVAIALASAR
jgi:uncharacterized protein YndB with AHSA1/START domain